MTGKGIVLFSFLLLISVVFGAVQNPLPENKAVRRGNTNVILSCSSSVSWQVIIWSVVPVGESVSKAIATGSYVNLPNDYNVSQSGNSVSNLIIKTVTESLAGTYICSENSGGSASAQLIVYNSDPVCTSNASSGQNLIQGQSVQMSCSFSYTATTRPSVDVNMVWSNGSSSSESPPVNTTTLGTLTTAVSTITPTAGYSPSFPVYRCQTSFKVTGTNATNDPGYTNITQLYSSPINVLYINPNCSIIGANSEGRIYYGNSITCQADANPLPSYSWSNGTSSTLSNDATVQITNDGLYTCTATNSVGRCTKSINLTVYTTTAAPTTTITTTITPPSTSSQTDIPSLGQSKTGELSETNKIIIGVVVGVGGFLLILAIIIIICCCKKKNKSGAKYENGNTKPMADYPPPYDGHVGPQRNARPDSVVYASADRQHPSQSSYVSNSPAHPHIGDDGLNYAQIQLDNQPRSRQPLQMPENNSNYVEIALA